MGGAQAVSHRLTIADQRLNYCDADICRSIGKAVEGARQRHDSARAGTPIRRVAARLVAESDQRPRGVLQEVDLSHYVAGERGDAIGCQRTAP